MAQRKRTVSLDSLVAELKELDSRRKTIVGQLNTVIRSLGGGAVPAPLSPAARRGRPASGKNMKRKGRRKRTMSAAARKNISEAQKKRWAEQKAGSKKR